MVPGTTEPCLLSRGNGIRRFFSSEITPPLPSYISDTGIYLPVILHKAAMLPSRTWRLFCIHPSTTKEPPPWLSNSSPTTANASACRGIPPISSKSPLKRKSVIHQSCHWRRNGSTVPFRLPLIPRSNRSDSSLTNITAHKLLKRLFPGRSDHRRHPHHP